MKEEILVPTLGESITEATVSKWLKNSGDKVTADEPIVELETDKVNLEVPSPVDGVLSEIKNKEGQTVQVGSILGIVFTINIDTIRNLLNSTFNLNLFPSEFYYLDKMPTSIDLTQIILIIFFSLIISIIATVYPAYKASKTEIRGILNNV